jgi:hypothetical protein
MMIIIKAFDQLQQRAPPGAPRAASGPRQIVTRSAKLFANFSETFKKVILISFAVLRTCCTTHAIVFQAQP